VLQIVAEQLTNVAKRVTDIVSRSRIISRYGGDEFVMILVGTNEQDAISRAQAAVNAVAIAGVGITSSAGVATGVIRRREDLEKHLTNLYKRGDSALRIAKQSGKNQISIAPSSSL
jgi:diguanylate cyclase